MFTCNRIELADFMHDMSIVCHIPLYRMDKEWCIGRYYVTILQENHGKHNITSGCVVIMNCEWIVCESGQKDLWMPYSKLCCKKLILPFRRIVTQWRLNRVHFVRCLCRNSLSIVHIHPRSHSCATRHRTIPPITDKTKSNLLLVHNCCCWSMNHQWIAKQNCLCIPSVSAAKM